MFARARRENHHAAEQNNQRSGPDRRLGRGHHGAARGRRRHRRSGPRRSRGRLRHACRHLHADPGPGGHRQHRRRRDGSRRLRCHGARCLRGRHRARRGHGDGGRRPDDHRRPARRGPWHLAGHVGIAGLHRRRRPDRRRRLRPGLGQLVGRRRHAVRPDGRLHGRRGLRPRPGQGQREDRPGDRQGIRRDGRAGRPGLHRAERPSRRLRCSQRPPREGVHRPGEAQGALPAGGCLPDGGCPGGALRRGRPGLDGGRREHGRGPVLRRHHPGWRRHGHQRL